MAPCGRPSAKTRHLSRFSALFLPLTVLCSPFSASDIPSNCLVLSPLEKAPCCIVRCRVLAAKSARFKIGRPSSNFRGYHCRSAAPKCDAHLRRSWNRLAVRGSSVCEPAVRQDSNKRMQVDVEVRRGDKFVLHWTHRNSRKWALGLPPSKGVCRGDCSTFHSIGSSGVPPRNKKEDPASMHVIDPR